MRRAIALRAVKSVAASASAALSPASIAAASSERSAAAAASAISPSPPAARARPSLPPRPRLNLLSLSLSQLESELSALGLPRFRARQMLGWVYNHGAASFASMDGFTPRLKQHLEERFEIGTGIVRDMQVAADHTRKLLIGFPSAKSKLAVPATDAADSAPGSPPPPLDQIETVYIPMGPVSTWSSPAEGAVCVSSQVGCSLSCTFCHTGMGMDKRKLRNLTSAEIVNQVLLVQRAMGDFGSSSKSNERSQSPAPAAPSRRAVTNIVLMGMGEPLYNFRHVSRALHVLTSSSSEAGVGGGFGLGFGRGRITLSTSGVVPGIDALLSEFGGNINLAISLHAASDAVRDEIVPINRTWPLHTLMDSVRRYQNGRRIADAGEDAAAASDPSLNSFAPLSLAGRKRITFEYVMLAGVNDSLSEALALSRLLDGIVSLVNLIPFNPWEGSAYTSSDPAHIVAFAEELRRLGVPATIRWPRGRDIQGACGQLAVKHATAAALGAIA